MHSVHVRACLLKMTHPSMYRGHYHKYATPILPRASFHSVLGTIIDHVCEVGYRTDHVHTFVSNKQSLEVQTTMLRVFLSG